MQPEILIDISLMTLSLDNIFPLIVPASYYVKGTWELPHHALPNQSYILTWVTFGAAGIMNYLTQEQDQDLNNIHENWQQKSFENLRHSLADNERLFTQYKMSSNKQQLLWICFMNNDGIGSSRILLSNELAKVFPNGYFVAFPDRSCGLVIANNIDEMDLKEIKEIVKGMHKEATTAMSGQIHSASDFALPAEWIRPIDIEFSRQLTNDIV